MQSAAFACNFFRDAVRGFHIHAADLHIDRGGHPEVKDGIDKSAGLKVSADFRNFATEPVPNLSHVFETANFVPFRESDLNERCVRSRVRSING